MEIVATDFAYQLPDAKIPAGPVPLTLVNKGAEIHQLTLVRLPEGVRPDDVKSGLRNGDGSVLGGATSVGVPTLSAPEARGR